MEWTSVKVKQDEHVAVVRGTVRSPCRSLHVVGSRLVLVTGKQVRCLDLDEAVLQGVKEVSWTHLEVAGVPPVVLSQNCPSVKLGDYIIFLNGHRERMYPWDDQYKASVFILDMTDSDKPRWCHPKTSGDIPCNFEAVFLLDESANKAYTFRWSTGPTRQGRLWALDLKTFTWSKTKTFGDEPAPRYASSVCELDGKMFYMFGNTKQMQSDFFTLDLNTGQWQRGNPSGTLPDPCNGAGAVVDNVTKHIYIISGHFGQDCDQVRILDASSPEKYVWSKVPSKGQAAESRLDLVNSFCAIGYHDDTKQSFLVQLGGFSGRAMKESSDVFVIFPFEASYVESDAPILHLKGKDEAHDQKNPEDDHRISVHVPSSVDDHLAAALPLPVIRKLAEISGVTDTKSSVRKDVFLAVREQVSEFLNDIVPRALEHHRELLDDDDRQQEDLDDWEQESQIDNYISPEEYLTTRRTDLSVSSILAALQDFSQERSDLMKELIGGLTVERVQRRIVYEVVHVTYDSGEAPEFDHESIRSEPSDMDSSFVRYMSDGEESNPGEWCNRVERAVSRLEMARSMSEEICFLYGRPDAFHHVVCYILYEWGFCDRITKTAQFLLQRAAEFFVCVLFSRTVAALDRGDIKADVLTPDVIQWVFVELPSAPVMTISDAVTPGDNGDNLEQ
ncbi:RABEPK [Branchiostoma lanceolatum]|uniref:RABEPK protein n=1 Tax=Branchiostoma lanceolatum TaxID=7740 RepID=A0A8K0F3H3_BRALA|nr:RABEPK [Branchiostoma lanceolatum]